MCAGLRGALVRAQGNEVIAGASRGWVGWGILTANLATISRTVATRQAK